MNVAHFFSDLETQQIIEGFVELALSKPNVMVADHFLEEEIELIRQLIELAGYEPQKLEPGLLITQHRSVCGVNRGFTVNQRCPFFVVNQAGINDRIATTWIDFIFSIVTQLRVSKTGQSEKEFILLRQLKQMLPFQPIRVTVDGDFLKDQPLPVEVAPDRYQFTDCATQDEDEISSSVAGIHQHCGGFMECMRVTENHKALVCRKCHLRIVIPKEIVTYGDLREHMEDSLP